MIAAETPRKRYRTPSPNPMQDLDHFLSMEVPNVVEPDPFATVVWEMLSAVQSKPTHPQSAPAPDPIPIARPPSDDSRTKDNPSADESVERSCNADEIAVCAPGQLDCPTRRRRKAFRRKAKPSPAPHEHGQITNYTCFRFTTCVGKVVLAADVPLKHGDTALCSAGGHVNAYCSVCNGFFDKHRVVLFPKPDFKYKRNGQHCVDHPPRQRNGGRLFVSEAAVDRPRSRRR